MTGTLAVTAGRGEAALGRAAPEIAGAGPWPGWGRTAKALFRPVGPAAIRVSYSVGIYPRKKYADRRYKRFPGYTAVIATRTAGTIRRYRDLESPAARHETRRIGKAAGMAAAGSLDRPFRMIAALIMGRANRAAEGKAVAGPA